MKIGTSLSKCVIDIARGVVDIDDVACIITRTRMTNSSDYDAVIAQYKRIDWQDHPEECELIASTLWNTGRIHQPRLSPAPLGGIQRESIWYDLSPSIHADSPIVKEAYETYLALVRLHSQQL